MLPSRCRIACGVVTNSTTKVLLLLTGCFFFFCFFTIQCHATTRGAESGSILNTVLQGGQAYTTANTTTASFPSPASSSASSASILYSQLPKEHNWRTRTISLPNDLDPSNSNFTGRMRLRRKVSNIGQNLDIKVSQLDDLYQRAVIHWSGEDSDVVFVVTQQQRSGTITSSHVYRSTDYAATWQRVPFFTNNQAIIAGFNPSPHSKEHLIFVDTVQQRLYVTQDEGVTFQTVTVPFRTRILDFAPDREGLVCAVDATALYCSASYGLSWAPVTTTEGMQLILDELHWGKAGTGTDDAGTAYALSAATTTNGNSADARILVRINTLAYTASVIPLAFSPSPGSFRVTDYYMFAAAPANPDSGNNNNNNQQLWVSAGRSDFELAHFAGPDSQFNYILLDASEDRVLVAVRHDNVSNVYASDARGTSYSLTLEGLHMVSFGPGGPSRADFTVVDGVDGIYFAVRVDPSSQLLQSLISFDEGARWEPVSVPEGQECGNAVDEEQERIPCGLQVHMQTSAATRSINVPSILTQESAPGFVLANGNVGRFLSRSSSAYVSSDAGLSWSALDVRQGAKQFAMLEHGGVLVAADTYDPRGAGSTAIHFSIDEGNSWATTSIPFSQNLHIVGMHPEPGEATDKLIVFGYPASMQPFAWTIVRMDFSSVLTAGACRNPDDYTEWSPRDAVNPVACLMGERDVYERRKKNVPCKHGYNYDRPVSKTPCQCESEDFECDFGYERETIDGMCVPVAPKYIVPPCEPGTTTAISRGYRKVAGNGCAGGIEPLLSPMPYECPCGEWSDWTPCDPCLERSVQTRTREQRGDIPCPCLKEVRECVGASLTGKLKVEPSLVRVTKRQFVELFATLPGEDCDTGSVFGAVGYRWSLPAALAGSTAIKTGDVLRLDSGVAETGIYSVGVTAANALGKANAKSTILVYERARTLSVGLTFQKGDSGGGGSGASDLSGYEKHFRDTFPALARIDPPQLDAVKALPRVGPVPSDGSEIARLRFNVYLMSASEGGGGNDGTPVTTTKDILAILSSLAPYVDANSGHVLVPVPDSARDEGVASTSGSSTANNNGGGGGSGGGSEGGSDPTGPLVGACVAILVVIAVGSYYYRRKGKALRARYMRIGGLGEATAAGGVANELYDSGSESETELHIPGNNTSDGSTGAVSTPSLVVVQGDLSELEPDDTLLDY
eukprot:UC1_evm1s380